MLFFKLILPLFALIGPTCFASAAPSAPVSDHTVREIVPNILQSRQLDTIQGIVASLQQELTPILAKISQFCTVSLIFGSNVPNRGLHFSASLSATPNANSDQGAEQMSALMSQAESIVGKANSNLATAAPVALPSAGAILSLVVEIVALVSVRLQSCI